MNSDIIITPGKLIALWRILLMAHKHNGSTINEIYRATHNSSAMGGSIPLKAGIQIGINYDFIRAHQNKYYLSDFSLNELIIDHINIEPSFPILRKICHRIIKDLNIPWIIYFNIDVELFKLSIPNNWLEVLEMADLLNFEEMSVLDWWHSLIKKKTELQDEKLSSIGQIGERLTMDFEISRLTSNLISEPNKKVIWVALLSDEYGYDILSKSGSLFKKVNLEENIFIEVKSSDISNPKVFTFYFTENEFRKAKILGDSYFIYCWPGVKLIEKTSIYNSPFIIPFRQIFDLLPLNKSSNCVWTKCRIMIDVEEFSIRLFNFCS